MINARKIEPVSFWAPSGTRIADHIVLYNFHNYNFDGTDSMVSFRLVRFVYQQQAQAEVPESIYEGSIAIPNDVVQEWGEDDEPMFDYVITQLNLTRVEE